MRTPPAYIQDDTHHGGWVIIITAVGVVVTLLSLSIRLCVRLKYRSTLYAADGVLAIAGLFALVQSGLVFWEVSKGLGTALDLLPSSSILTLQKSNFAATVLYFFTVYLSKCVVICVYLHLSPEKTVRRGCHALLALSTAWFICSALLIGIDCALIQPWREVAARCTNAFIRWQIVAGIDVATEILLFLLSIALMAPTQMQLRRKSIVVTAFGIRLLIVIPCLLRLHFLNKQIHSTTPTMDAAITYIWTEIQLHFSIVCSVTYCYRSFTAAVSTNFGCAIINLEAYEETNGNLSAYIDSKRTSKGSKANAITDVVDGRFVGHRGRYSSTTIITSGGRSPDVHRPKKSGESTMVIIQEEVHVESSRTTPTRELVT